MLTYPPADRRTAPFAPPLDESAAWQLVGLAVAPEAEARESVRELASRSVEFLAWSLVRERSRSGRLCESLDELLRGMLAGGCARFLLGEENQTFATSPHAIEATEFRRRLDESLPRTLKSERTADDPQRTFDRAVALAPAYAMIPRDASIATDPAPAIEAESELPWSELPLPEGWKRLWRRAVLRHGIDERAFQRELIAAAREASTGAMPFREERPSLAYRTLQRTAELALAQEASEALIARRLDAERWASMKALAYGASHEINNPLANIASRAQALAMDEQDIDRLAKLRTIERQAFRAFTMIQNLTLVAEPPAPQIARFDWSEALDRFVRKWREEAAGKGIRLERVEAPNQAFWVSADLAQTELIFDELIRNAIEASSSDTRIGVSGPTAIREDESEGPRSYYLVEIVDEGSGLSPVARERLFDPFFSGREAGRGQGFGLSKARRIVENHGGSLRCRERSSRGLTMQWLLPPGD